MDIKQIVASALVALVVTIVGVVSLAPATKTIIERQSGAVASPDIPSPYLRWGGVTEWASAQKPLAATYNFCAMQSPAATSTLLSAGVVLSVSTTTSGTLFFAKASTATASTTQIGTNYAFTGGSQIALVASSSPGSAAQTEVFSPNTYFIVGFRGEGAQGITNLAPQGVCNARWISYQDL